MDIADILLIAFGLAMDAFAVSVCKGLALHRRDLKKAGIIAAWFSVFQMAMPLLGYLAGTQFRELASRMDHWIAFLLLSLIGGLMIRESFHPKEENADSEVSFRITLPLAVATSIDALVTGITFAFLSVNIWAAVGTIGAVTFLLCAAGVEMGRVLGRRLEKRARLLGGIVLILIGLKILIEHLAGLA
jgi:putative Mn2+ efflux pump MntP